MHSRKPIGVRIFDKTSEVKRCASISEAARYLKMGRKSIAYWLRAPADKCKGYAAGEFTGRLPGRRFHESIYLVPINPRYVKKMLAAAAESAEHRPPPLKITKNLLNLELEDLLRLSERAKFNPRKESSSSSYQELTPLI